MAMVLLLRALLAVGDVISAIITSATQMTVTLTDAAAAAMEGTVTFLTVLVRRIC